VRCLATVHSLRARLPMRRPPLPKKPRPPLTSRLSFDASAWNFASSAPWWASMSGQRTENARAAARRQLKISLLARVTRPWNKPGLPGYCGSPEHHRDSVGAVIGVSFFTSLFRRPERAAESYRFNMKHNWWPRGLSTTLLIRNAGSVAGSTREPAPNSRRA
jgi:hypothetical protein